jgi:predicted DsbA family dithiol-disulfide isomerase
MKPKIIAYSDNVCPFCFIGAKRLAKIQQEIPFEVEWRSFELHPEVPENGMHFTEYFGDQSERFVTQVTDYGSDVGITIKTRSLYNSKASLKVNEFAKKQGRFNEFHAAVFKAFLVDDLNIGNIETLLDVAEHAGLDREATRLFIESPEAEYLISESRNEALRLGINSVPSFIINNNLIRGAYPLETMTELIGRALAEK